jgi:hypothetical protein
MFNIFERQMKNTDWFLANRRWIGDVPIGEFNQGGRTKHQQF